ncbi:PIN domain nuclease [Candidatus Dojkabacteria bacterium]|jgi:predicted nucleic acid-binding protein|nr:PIN domain nuclease [Candidatus Dojkabacteria bacterium]
MKLFLDANIIIDYLTNRNGTMMDLISTFDSIGSGNLYISALSIHITNYILKIKFKSELHELMKHFLTIVEIIPLGKDIVLESTNNPFKDFEDSLQFFSASKYCDTILTRNPKDFKYLKEISKSDIRIIS